MRVAALVLLLGFLLLPVRSSAAPEKCISCHDVVERYAKTPRMGHLICTDCHFGNGSVEDKELAHSGMYADPTDYRIIDKTCGPCHPRIVEDAKKWWKKSHIEDLNKIISD